MQDSSGRKAHRQGRRHAQPLATYRLQLNAGFTFADVQRVVPYLKRLGISHIYVSPFTHARPGSTHGYDVIDPTALNPEIGDEAGLKALSETLAAHDMGLILDFVPNHMGIGQADNKWWLDVLEWGQASPYAASFDIDWLSDKRELVGKILVPFLGDQYGIVLEAGELTLRFDAAEGAFDVRYHEHRFPIRPRHFALLIDRALEREPPPDGRAEIDALRNLSSAFAALRPENLGRARQNEIHRHGAELKAALATLAQDPTTADWLARAAAAWNGTPGQPQSFRSLHGLLERQAYRLAFWRVAADEINYRRFFDINDLIGIRQELLELFQRTHRLVERLAAEDRIQGLRIDHADGLFDPAGYCADLRALMDRACARADAPPENGPARYFPIYVEKILAHNERLRADWKIDGTTGYDFLAQVNHLFVQPAAEAAIERAYRQFTGATARFEDVVYAAKHLVMESSLASELNVLARQLDRIGEQHWRTRDFTFERLRHALIETVASFSVYRTYVTAAGCTERDRQIIDAAIAGARRRWRGPDREILDFLHSALTADLGRQRQSGYSHGDVVRFAMKFQQYTAPVMAKGLEDTTCYRYTRFMSLNEVGSDPNLFRYSAGAFHAANDERQRTWSHAMLTTATHDTKRGEDARPRIDALSEMAPAWGRTARRWRRFNRRFRREIDGQRVPALVDEFMLYQTLIGAWPAELAIAEASDATVPAAFRERMKAYLVKALREAKTISSWSFPNEPYESGCCAFLDAILEEGDANFFLKDFRAFMTRVALLGALASLSQCVLKCFSPGFPDIYQGTELWDFSLVDPDNRRPVDFDARTDLLEDFAAADTSANDPDRVAALMRGWPSGAIKLWVLHRSLMLRNAQPELFAQGAYEPLRIEGEYAPHIVAFARRSGSDTAIVMAGRWFDALLPADAAAFPGAADWKDTAIATGATPAGELVDILTSRRFAPETERFTAADLLATLPVAVLVNRSN